jgi:hypothetical protein
VHHEMIALSGSHDGDDGRDFGPCGRSALALVRPSCSVLIGNPHDPSVDKVDRTPMSRGLGKHPHADSADHSHVVSAPPPNGRSVRRRPPTQP